MKTTMQYKNNVVKQKVGFSLSTCTISLWYMTDLKIKSYGGSIAFKRRNRVT